MFLSHNIYCCLLISDDLHTHIEKSFRNLIKSNRNQIVLYIFRLIWNSKRTASVCCSKVNRKMVNTIWFRFDLIRFRTYFTVCGHVSILWRDWITGLSPGITETQLCNSENPISITTLWYIGGLTGALNLTPIKSIEPLKPLTHHNFMMYCGGFNRNPLRHRNTSSFFSLMRTLVTSQHYDVLGGLTGKPLNITALWCIWGV